jgi:hypothetical protein
MARVGTKPSKTKTNYILRPEVPAGQKQGAPEFNWMVDKLTAPRNVIAFQSNVLADDEYSFGVHTQSGVINFTKDASVQAGEGAGNGFFGIIVSDGSAINFSSDFDMTIPLSFTAGKKYVLSAVWNGTTFEGFLFIKGTLTVETILSFGAAVTKTISSNILTIGSDRNIIVNAETGITDTIEQILPTDIDFGTPIILTAQGAAITLKNEFPADAGGLKTINGGDFILPNNKSVQFVYQRDDGLGYHHWHQLGDPFDYLGNFSGAGQAKGGATTVSYSATASFDMNDGNIQKMVMTGNVTSFALTNKVNGSSYRIIFEIGGAGGYTLPTPAASVGTATDNAVENGDFPSTVGSKIIYDITVEPDGDTFHSVETITV